MVKHLQNYPQGGLAVNPAPIWMLADSAPLYFSSSEFSDFNNLVKQPWALILLRIMMFVSSTTWWTWQVKTDWNRLCRGSLKVCVRKETVG